MCASTTPAAQLRLLAGNSIHINTTIIHTSQISSSDTGSSQSSSPNSSSATSSCSGSSVDTSSSHSSSLRSVGLCYSDMAATAAAAPGWSGLPLRVLELRAAEGTLPTGTVKGLGQLQQLRQLDVYGGSCGGFSQAAAFEATQGQLAAALSRMTALEVRVSR
jgi:hypothetical protein